MDLNLVVTVFNPEVLQSGFGMRFLGGLANFQRIACKLHGILQRASTANFSALFLQGQASPTFRFLNQRSSYADFLLTGVGLTTRGSCNNTPLRRVLRRRLRASVGTEVLRRFLEGGGVIEGA